MHQHPGISEQVYFLLSQDSAFPLCFHCISPAKTVPFLAVLDRFAVEEAEVQLRVEVAGAGAMELSGLSVGAASFLAVELVLDQA